MEKCRARYPALEEDLVRSQQRPGVMAYLFNTLLDMEPLGWLGEEDDMGKSKDSKRVPQVAENGDENEEVELMPHGEGLV